MSDNMMRSVFITGSTGMVGKGVLYECLDDETIGAVTVLNRSSLGLNHHKLKEICLDDFMNIDQIKGELDAFDACFHCMGVSAVGLSETQYNRITFEMTQKLADVMYDINADMVFNYVSGSGTDSTEQGRSMWARVKGKAENYVLRRGFREAYMFRPGAIIPEKGITSRTSWYNVVFRVMRPFFPLLKRSKNITTTTKIGRAMINSISRPIEAVHLENKDINRIAAL